MLQNRLTLVLIAYLNLLTYGMDSSCDIHHTVEKEDTKTIRCDVLGPVEAHYWYQGSTSDSQPILLLKNGNKDGTLYNDGHYDITDEGYMKIANAQIEHEGVYTYTAIFTNRSTWTQTISIQVTVTPEPPCPMIQFCFGCEECKMKVLSTSLTTLSCVLDEIRPKFELHWLDEGGKTMLNQSRSEVMNPLTHTWTISSSITVKLDSCGEQKDIYCGIQNDGGMSSIANRTVVILSEECYYEVTVTPSLETSEKPSVVWPIIVCVLLLLCIVAICLIWNVMKRRKRREIKKQGSIESLETVLKQFYLNDLLLGNMEQLYNSDRKYDVSFSSCQKHLDETLLFNVLNKNERIHRVLFLGAAGIGKTCLLRHILRKWSNGEILQGQILIYLQVWRIAAKTCLIEEVEDMLTSSLKISSEFIQQTLQNRDTIIILDGIRPVNKLKISGKVNQHNFNSWSPLTKENEKFPKMKIWVACREADENIVQIFKPSMTVLMKDFGEEDISNNLEKFVETLKLSTSAESSLTDESCIEDEQKEEDSENFPLVDKHGFASSKAYDVDVTFLPTVIKHLHDIISEPEKNIFINSLLGRILVLLYLRHDCKDEVDKKINAINTFISDKPNFIDQFITDKNWEIVACLLETWAENESELLDLAKDLQLKDVVFSHMTVDSHLQSLLHFFKVLTLSNTKLLSLDIYVKNPLYIVSYLPLVEGSLVVRSAHLSLTDFKSFITVALKRSKTIEFWESDLPENLEEDLDISSQQCFNVCHTKDNNTVYFNFQEGKRESK